MNDKELTKEEQDKYDLVGVKIMVKIQKDLLKTLEEFGDEAVACGFTLEGVAYSAGSAIGSVMYEMIKEGDKGGMNAKQEEIMFGAVKSMLEGWERKMAILRDPVEFEKVAVPEQTH